MIKADQPTCFSSAVSVAVSSKKDGQMQYGKAEPDEKVKENRHNFLKEANLPDSKLALVQVRYSDDLTYDKIIIKEDGPFQTEGSDVQENADCLVTTTPGVALFLPVADCVATVVYDPVKNVLALAHLGRHSSVAKLAKKLVNFLKINYNSEPSNLKVWMAPSIKPPYYTIKRADFAANDSDWNDYCTKTAEGYSLDLNGYNRQLFIASGILQKNIHCSAVDTATDKNYWSHFTQTTVLEQPEPPRFAVAACLL